MCLLQVFFLSLWFPHSLDIIFYRAEVINFNDDLYVWLFLYDYCIVYSAKEVLLTPRTWRFFLMFSFRIFAAVALHFMFRSIITFNWIFCLWRELEGRCVCVFFHKDMQLTQQHLLERPFPPTPTEFNNTIHWPY